MINQKLLSKMLTKLGHSSAIADNGLLGFEAIKKSYEPGERHFDLALVDVAMPVMDGREATRAIRSWFAERSAGRSPNAPPELAPLIVGLTAHALSTERDKCLEAGMNAVLTKPCSFATIAAQLHFWSQPGAAEAVAKGLAKPPASAGQSPALSAASTPNFSEQQRRLL